LVISVGWPQSFLAFSTNAIANSLALASLIGPVEDVGAVADFFLASPSAAFSVDALVSPAFNARRISCCVSSGLQATARAAFSSPPAGRQEMPIRTASQGPAGTETPKVAEVLGAKSRYPSNNYSVVSGLARGRRV
jgi:hypothetical protein